MTRLLDRVESPELVLRPKTVARGCAISIGLLVAIHTASSIARFGFGRDYQLGLASRVYLGAEMSIPNWFSTILLLGCAAALLAIGAVRRDRDSRRWIALGVVFVALSIDEAAALHDLVSPFFAWVFMWLAAAVGGPFTSLARKSNYAWEVPAVFFVLGVGAAYIPFLRRLPAATRNLFVLAGLIYVGGAVGVDFLEGWYSGVYGPRTPTFVVLVACEETLEMAGASVFLYALLQYAEFTFGELRIRLTPDGEGRDIGHTAA